MAVIRNKIDNDAVTCLDLEIAVANHFGYRQNLIVPNVSYGLGFGHEIDVLVVTASGYATECEIKTSRADLRRDSLKTHNHASARIKRYFFVVPEKLGELALECARENWGVLAYAGYYLRTLREARVIAGAKPLTSKETNHLHQLASMRVWTLKERLRQRINRQRLLASGSNPAGRG